MSPETKPETNPLTPRHRSHTRTQSGSHRTPQPPRTAARSCPTSQDASAITDAQTLSRRSKSARLGAHRHLATPRIRAPITANTFTVRFIIGCECGPVIVAACGRQSVGTSLPRAIIVAGCQLERDRVRLSKHLAAGMQVPISLSRRGGLLGLCAGRHSVTVSDGAAFVCLRLGFIHHADRPQHRRSCNLYRRVPPPTRSLCWLNRHCCARTTVRTQKVPPSFTIPRYQPARSQRVQLQPPPICCVSFSPNSCLSTAGGRLRAATPAAVSLSMRTSLLNGNKVRGRLLGAVAQSPTARL